MTYPRIDAADLPAVDAGTMRDVDQHMEQKVGIDLVRMMENAGRALSEVAITDFAPRHVVVLHGSGGNGGGALVAARHLVNRGVEVTLVSSGTPLTPVPRAQRVILDQMGVLEAAGKTPPSCDLVIDGLVGYSLRGRPSGRVAELIGWAGAQRAPVLSLDVPSGFDAEQGEFLDPAIDATATVTLALPKKGLAGHARTGRLYLADISVPSIVYRDLGLRVAGDLFAKGQVLQVV